MPVRARLVRGAAAGLLALGLTLGLAPAALAQGADLRAGKAQAAAACALCHGPLGQASMVGAPNLAGQSPLYLEEQLRNYRSGKRPHELMGVVAKALSDSQIIDLAAWYGAIVVQVSPP